MFGVASYGFAALVYGAMTVILLVSHPGGRRATWLIVATAGSALWGVAVAVLLLEPAGPPGGVLIGFDALHSFIWTACVLAWLAPPAGEQAASALPIARWLLIASSGFGLWALVIGIGFASVPALADTVYPDMLCMTLVGFLAVEQVFRNARGAPQRSLLWLCLAIGGVFVVDLFAYSHATLFGGLTPLVWQTRGIANAALVPLLVLATKRQPDWERELFVSRQVAFYTASVIGVGCYLLTMGVVAYVIRGFGGRWGPWLEGAFLLGALALLVLVLLSSTIRARFRIFLVKHFYRNKYDYRQEWLRLTEGLGGSAEPHVLARQALRGLARIAASPRGSLWLLRAGASSYECAASIGGVTEARAGYSRREALVRFLDQHGWVIDSEEYARNPALYGSAFGHPEEGVLPAQSVIVPLDCQGTLLGFAVLERPAELGALNFEDHDILKTAGRQIAVVLAQALAQEQLAHTRQFEAMSKLSTFLMHDLKNTIAQQELVVANAQRFRHRPEFIDDAINTIQSSVARMKRVLEQLQSGPPVVHPRGRADVAKVMSEIESRCAGREPRPRVELPQGALWAEMEPEPLASALTHLVRNAQDATPASGSVRISVAEQDGTLWITVTDTGCGMDQAFVRERLFRPFDSTKGAKGMGIGAYQARDAVRAAGGEIEVTSAPGEGTTMRVSVPCVRSAVEAVRVEKPAASGAGLG